MNDIYLRMQIAGAQKDEADILSILSDIKTGKLKNDLMLLNYHREVPVSYAASVAFIEKDSAELIVNQIQAVVISFEKITVLKSSHFKRDVIANVNYVNVEKSRIILSTFSYAVVRADRRMSVRVELDEPLTASFFHSKGSLKGKLVDMSLTGVSLSVATDPGITASEEGELDILLPKDSTTVPAKLLKTMNTSDGCRLIFEITPSRTSEVSISQYIFRRQLEIIKELKDHPGVN